MTRVVIGVADQALAHQVRSSLEELEDTQVVAIAATSDEVVRAVTEEDPDVVLVHEGIGPEPSLSLARDLGVRRPAAAMLLLASDPTSDVVAQAMDAGARGLVTLPLSFGQMEARVTSAAGWSARMRRLLGTGEGGGPDEDGRGRLVVLAGAKGGVGTTTVATHLALDVTRTVPGLDVCLVDLDLEKGDVPSIVEVRHRLGVGDLAKVADDLSAGTVADVMTHHESGLDMLLAPLDVRDVESVTPRALRQVLAAVRRRYDLVLVDAGAHVTPAQATVLELADEVVLVVNPDVASLRGLRRVVSAWDSLGVAKEEDVRVLVNRTSSSVTVSPDTVRQLTRAPVLETGLPASFRRLEPALNARDPFEVRSPQWWGALRSLGKEIGVVPQTRDVRRRVARRTVQEEAGRPEGRAAGTPDARRAGRRARGARPSRETAGDRGSLTVETLGLLPLFGALLVLVWHMAMVGGAFVVQSNAASVAAREYAISGDTGRAQEAARASVIPPWRSRLSVSGDAGALEVTLDVPGVVDGFPGLPDEVSSRRGVVQEP